MDKERERRSERKRAEKPRWDNWHVRLPNPKDQQRAIDLFHKSGAETKSDFVRARILGEHLGDYGGQIRSGILPKAVRTDGTNP